MLLSQEAHELFDLTLTPEQGAQFDLYVRELADWNNRVNLTAIVEPEAVRVRHFLDSFSLVRAANFTENLRLIDVGSGAGFPGLPLAILYPHLRITLLESTGKKVDFLNHLIQLLELENVTTLTARAEEAGQNPAHREAYDLVVARAVARLPALLEYLLPLARTGGRCIAMKGETAHEEAQSARSALSILGGALDKIIPVTLPRVPETHYLICVDKKKPTPAQYPRRPGLPTRKPL